MWEATIHSAEAVLIAENAKKWKRNIDAWYRLPLVRNIIGMRKKGTEIKASSYILR